ncbi:DUF1272 domain-containing protein [Patiriisocius marinistellae]|nr:DUF1272 domain-containing protein [Patiriisocius marinistellae]
MLEIRPSCEQCNKALSYNTTDAMICTFECTYCKECASKTFKNTCPNCGGNFTQRPIRPKHLLENYPASTTIVFKPKQIK